MPSSLGNNGNTASLEGVAVTSGCYIMIYMKPVLFKLLNKEFLFEGTGIFCWGTNMHA